MQERSAVQNLAPLGRTTVPVVRATTAALLAGCLAVAVAGCSRDGGAGLVPRTQEERDALVGTCLVVDSDVGEQVSSLPKVSCDQEHTHEIYAVVPFAPDSPATGTTVDPKDLAYPGEEALTQFAEAACHREFRTYVGIDAIDSQLFYSWMIPTVGGWNGSREDRSIVCVVGDPSSPRVTGSVKLSRK
jgi:Septum formation